MEERKNGTHLRREGGVGGEGGLQIRLTGRLKREKESLCGRGKGSETEKEIGRERREGTREH